MCDVVGFPWLIHFTRAVLSLQIKPFLLSGLIFKRDFSLVSAASEDIQLQNHVMFAARTTHMVEHVKQMGVDTMYSHRFAVEAARTDQSEHLWGDTGMTSTMFTCRQTFQTYMGKVCY